MPKRFIVIGDLNEEFGGQIPSYEDWPAVLFQGKKAFIDTGEHRPDNGARIYRPTLARPLAADGEIRNDKVPKFDFSDWNFDLDDVLQPIAVRVAEVVMEHMMENELDCAWCEDERGPCFYLGEEYRLPVYFDKIRFLLLSDGCDAEDDEDRAKLSKALTGCGVGIALFQKWIKELQDEQIALQAMLDQLEAMRE